MKATEVLTKVFGGVLGAPFVAPFSLLIYMLYAWAGYAWYNQLAIPIASGYGYELPGIAFSSWLALVVFMNIIKIWFTPMNPNHYNVELQENIARAAGSRLGALILCVILSYVINWIWL